MKRKYLFCLYFYTSIAVFTQNLDTKQITQLNGVWENGGRFIEFADSEKPNEKNMRIVLKPYYRFVYDKPAVIGNFDVTEGGARDLYFIRVMYPIAKKAVSLSAFVKDGFFYTSYYKKVDFSFQEASGTTASNDKQPILYGFWVEQGSPDGILLYPNKPVQFFDAYFFLNDVYIKFRYWLDDISYNDKKAIFKDAGGNTYSVPRLIKRGDLVYSCITSGGSTLRNYSTGVYSITEDKSAEKKSLRLTLSPKGAGPYSHSVGNTYPNPKYPVIENIRLDIAADGNIFAIGAPFLIKSNVTDLFEEIKKHNEQRKKTPEPDIIDDDLNFFWDDINNLQK